MKRRNQSPISSNSYLRVAAPVSVPSRPKALWPLILSSRRPAQPSTAIHCSSSPICWLRRHCRPGFTNVCCVDHHRAYGLGVGVLPYNFQLSPTTCCDPCVQELTCIYLNEVLCLSACKRVTLAPIFSKPTKRNLDPSPQCFFNHH